MTIVGAARGAGRTHWQTYLVVQGQVEVKLQGGAVQGVRHVVHNPRELGIDEVHVRRAFRPRWERRHRRDWETVSEAVAEANLRRTETERVP